MMVYYVWVGAYIYRLYCDGDTIRYEGNGPLVVKQEAKKKLKSNQQE